MLARSTTGNANCSWSGSTAFSTITLVANSMRLLNRPGAYGMTCMSGERATTDLHALLEAMTPEERRGALIALDAVSRPMQSREIEAALFCKGTSRSQRKAIVAAVKRFNIIAVIGPETDDG